MGQTLKCNNIRTDLQAVRGRPAWRKPQACAERGDAAATPAVQGEKSRHTAALPRAPPGGRGRHSKSGRKPLGRVHPEQGASQNCAAETLTAASALPRPWAATQSLCSRRKAATSGPLRRDGGKLQGAGKPATTPSTMPVRQERPQQQRDRAGLHVELGNPIRHIPPCCLECGRDGWAPVATLDFEDKGHTAKRRQVACLQILCGGNSLFFSLQHQRSPCAQSDQIHSNTDTKMRIISLSPALVRQGKVAHQLHSAPVFPPTPRHVQ